MDLESSSSDQKLGLFNPPFLLKNFSGYWTEGWGMRHNETQTMDLGCFWYAILFFLPSNFVAFAQKHAKCQPTQETEFIFKCRWNEISRDKLHMSNFAIRLANAFDRSGYGASQPRCALPCLSGCLSFHFMTSMMKCRQIQQPHLRLDSDF